MRLRNLMFALCATLFTSSVQAQGVVIDDNWAIGGLRWEGGGETKIAWRPVILEGELHICGAYSVKGGTRYNTLSREVIRQTYVRLNGDRLIRRASFFSILSSRHNATRFVGQTANCQGTGLQATSAVFPDLEFITPSGRISAQF